MKRGIYVTVLTIATLSLAALFSGCSSGGSSTTDNTPPPATVQSISANVTSATTWTPDNVYVLENTIYVSSDLTISPGTIVKFKAGTSLNVESGGTIIADAGNAATPILFTSLKDDTGGDSNADGTTTTPAKGDWGGIKIAASGSTFNFCTFSYGGDYMPYSGTMTIANNSSATVTNSVLAHNQGGTLTDTRAAALNAKSAAAGTILTGNTFYDNDIPLAINGLFNVDISNRFHHPTSGIKNSYNGIFWQGSGLTGNITWSNSEVPYVVNNAPLDIAAGSSLTLGDNVIVKLSGQRIGVAGALVADATSNIVFTSLKDDSNGGDTNGDAAATTPAKGDWSYINVAANGSLFNNCSFMYGGSAKPYTGTFDVSSSAGDVNVTVTNSTFAHNTGGTLSDIRAATLNIGSAAAGTIVTGNTFYDNDLPMVINGLVNIDNSNLFHATVESVTISNTFNGIFMDGVNHLVTGSVSWTGTEVPYVINNGTVLGIGDSDGASLTLGDNVILKLQSGRIDLNQYGTLNQGTGNYFTSLRDDTLLGDSDDDNSAAAVKGDWAGVNLCKPLCSWADWGNILYATNP